MHATSTTRPSRPTTLPKTFPVRVLRQDAPAAGRLLAGILRRLRAGHELHQRSAEDRGEPDDATAAPAAPVVWECNCLEEVCGACTMLINGRVRQACTALVDRLLRGSAVGIELRPMTNSP